MEQDIRGQVISIEGDEVLIAVDSEEQCHSCGLKDSCSNKTVTVKASEIDYQPSKGEPVQVIYKKLLLTSGLLYVVPLLAFFLGITFSSMFNSAQNELIHFLSGSVFLAVSFVAIKILGNKLTSKDFKIQIQPVK